jgi:3-phenylpropionate/cinnamic acid dioxygenase small subunit
MTQTTMTNELTVDARCYSQVEQFYAFQMQVIDDGDAAGWAATFVEDGVFTSNGMPEPVVGRDRLTAEAADTVARLSDAGTARRHIVSNVRIEQVSPDLLRVTSYVPVIDTTDGVAVLRTSTVMRDELVRGATGWLVRHREVSRDDLLSGQAQASPGEKS